MKKTMLVVMLFAIVAMVSAQDQKVAPKETQNNEKIFKKPIKTDLKEADLLPAIKEDLAKNYTGSMVEKAWKMEGKDGETYRIVIMKDNVKWNLMYDKNGKLLRKAEMKKHEVKKEEMKKMDAPKQ